MSGTEPMQFLHPFGISFRFGLTTSPAWSC